MRVLLITILAVSVPGLAGANARSAPAESTKAHTVKAGESLWVIARAHACSVDQLLAANALKANVIHAGDRLAIPRCVASKGAATRPADSAAKSGLTHTVTAGDTLGKIARQYDTSVEDLRLRNRMTGNLIRPGQAIAVAPGTSGRGQPILGQSVGQAFGGRLKNPSLLGSSPAYFRRRPNRAWGANYVVHQVRVATELVRREFPKVHRLSIGDISDRDGGHISEHRSHQSGRDIDIGFYFKRKPGGYPENFVRASIDTLDFEATWLLLTTFAATAKVPHGVERIYMSFETQKIIYDWALEAGKNQQVLDRLFEYPSGDGFIRHEPGHDDHFHVRFGCPKGDKGCY